MKCFCPARFRSKTNDSCRRLWKLKSPNTLYLQRGLLLRQEAGRLLVREPVPPGRLPGADDPAQRVVRVVSVARVVATTRAQTRPRSSARKDLPTPIHPALKGGAALSA